MAPETGFTEPAGYQKLFFILVRHFMGQTLLFSQKYIYTRYSENLAITRLYGFLLYLVIARFCSIRSIRKFTSFGHHSLIVARSPWSRNHRQNIRWLQHAGHYSVTMTWYVSPRIIGRDNTPEQTVKAATNSTEKQSRSCSMNGWALWFISS